MHDTRPSHDRPGPGTTEAEAPQGNTIPAQGETQDTVPRMPHERDESADAQVQMQPSAQRVGQTAHDDLERGLVDTSKGAELDATYDKVRDGEPKRRP